MGEIIFVLGGARSGKSSFALSEASRISGRKAFIATMEPLDSELQARVDAHRKERGPEWETFEEPLQLSPLMDRINGHYNAILVDCLTLWLSNHLLKNGGPTEEKTRQFIDSMKKAACPVFAVSNEVGMGIVPDTELGRAFRDEAGQCNRLMAAAADKAYFIVAGISQRIK